MIQRIAGASHGTQVFRELDAAVRSAAAGHGLTGGHCLATFDDATVAQARLIELITNQVQADYDPGLWDLIEKMSQSVVVTSSEES